MRATTKLNVKIPAGVSSGNYIQLRGQGEVGPRGGSAGDCLVFVEEKEHDEFVRDGNNIHYRLPVTISQAAFGDEVQVPTLTGKVKMKVSAGTQSGRVFRLRNRGLPDVDGRGVGDQLVEVSVWTPTHLGAEERRLLEELEEIQQKKATSEGKGFFERMKEALGT